MEPNHNIETIRVTELDALLEEYPSIVPEKLQSLDEQRYHIIPRTLVERKDSPHLIKSEVASLVDWKLSHGKFRPALKGLFQQNAEQAVHDITTDGFSSFSNSSESAKTSVITLAKLRGIGPATASLLLSVYDPQAVPFFSDELFRWCMYGEGRGKGWDRDIKYNMKEYLQIFEKVRELQARLKKEFQRDISAVDIEKVAYVLGKRGAGLDNDKVASPSHGIKRTHHTDDDDSRVANETPNSKAVETKDSKPSRRKTTTRNQAATHTAPQSKRSKRNAG